MSIPVIDFHTAFGMTALSGWSLVGVLWLVGRQFPRQGVGLAMVSVLLFGTSYLFIALSTSLPFKLAMSVGYACIHVGIAAITLSVRRFQPLPWGRVDACVIVLPVVLLLATVAIAGGDFRSYAQLSNIGFLVQMACFAAILWRMRKDITGHGWRVMLLGVALQALTLAPVALFGRPPTPPVSDVVSLTARLVLWAICLVMFLNLQVSVLAFLMMLLDRRAETERQSAELDALTQLPNRRSLERQLRRWSPMLAQEKAELAVLLLDIDHFKQINDRYGHAAGDQVLRQIAQLLRGELREGQLLARYGGEEFVVVLLRANQAAATRVAQQLVSAVRAQPMAVGSQALPITVSAGIHVQRLDAEPDWAKIVQHADAAMYAAKRGGRNRFALSGDWVPSFPD